MIPNFSVSLIIVVCVTVFHTHTHTHIHIVNQYIKILTAIVSEPNDYFYYLFQFFWN